MKVSGGVCSNLGRAHINIPYQAPHMQGLPHISELHPGTINLSIAPRKFTLLKSAFHFPGIDWGPKVEDFDFVTVTGITFGGEAYSIVGYLYLPTKSPNRQGREVLEIWTTRMEGVKQGDAVTVIIPDGYIEVSG